MSLEIRLRHRTLGGHVHCRMFVGPEGTAGGKAGDLVFRIDEWEGGVRAALDAGGVVILPEFEPPIEQGALSDDWDPDHGLSGDDL